MAASTMAEPYAAAPFRLVNAPPITTLLWSGVITRALTLRSADGAQPSRSPLAALKAASFLRATPRALLKSPPM